MGPSRMELEEQHSMLLTLLPKIQQLNHNISGVHGDGVLTPIFVNIKPGPQLLLFGKKVLPSNHSLLRFCANGSGGERRPMFVPTLEVFCTNYFLLPESVLATFCDSSGFAKVLFSSVVISVSNPSNFCLKSYNDLKTIGHYDKVFYFI